MDKYNFATKLIFHIAFEQDDPLILKGSKILMNRQDDV